MCKPFTRRLRGVRHCDETALWHKRFLLVFSTGLHTRVCATEIQQHESVTERCEAQAAHSHAAGLSLQLRNRLLLDNKAYRKEDNLILAMIVRHVQFSHPEGSHHGEYSSPDYLDLYVLLFG